MARYTSSKRTFWITLVLIGYFVSPSLCDIYMHNPRGSNNRQDENGRARKNANRMFDSQNNERGGYNVGNVYYFSGSNLQIEWTNQHSCADENTRCEIILQYMCHENLRDGTTTNTIPTNNNACLKKNCSTDFTYGMHEDNNYYTNCYNRRRNKGLFAADQKIRRDSATATRQNPNGQRYGYECAEERDYYPYWHPTPWRDIAVLTDTPSRCAFYRQESANVKERWDCRGVGRPIPNTEAECQKKGGNWTRTVPHGIPPPECREPQWTRDNHLGNTRSGYAPSYNWTIPKGVSSEAWCTLRVRYNITTSDYDAWSTNASGIPEETFAQKFGFASSGAATTRGYNFKTDPQVETFSNSNGKLKLTLAVNTQQFGRVFQDRSHAFRIRPAAVAGKIHNINVRGKRGNIVQVYPAVEYDFTPNRHEMAIGDYVHFQWTGSNNNPGNNDGQGTAGTDRNNVLLQAKPVFQQSSPSYRSPTFGLWSRSYPQNYANSDSSSSSFLFGWPKEDVFSLAFSGSLDARGYLNTAATYYDLGPRKITRSGVYHYMSSRNNDFSNRSQKGLLVVGSSSSVYFSVGSRGETKTTADGAVTISIFPNTFKKLETLRYQIIKASEGEKWIANSSGTAPPGSGYASDFFILGFDVGKPQKAIMVTMKVDTSKSINVFRGNPKTMSAWERLHVASSTSNSVSFYTDKDGAFIARYNNDVNAGLIAALVILAFLFICGAVVGLVVYFKRNPASYQNFRSMFASKV